MTAQNSFPQDTITALFAPPLQHPTAVEIFEISRQRLVDARLAKPEMFDSFSDRLPIDGRPFLLVPPQLKAVNEMDWNELMARIQLNGKTGQNYLTVSALKDLDPIVSVPRILAGVEDGRQRLNTKPSVAHVDIQSAGRFGYGLWTGYIHAVVFTEVLNHHYMDLIRSRYLSGHVPYLYLLDSEPSLDANWHDRADPRWGAPSFGSQLEG